MKKKAAGRTPAKAAQPAKTRKATSARAVSVGAEVLAGLKQALAHRRGEHVPGLIVHAPVDVKAIREGTGLSQDRFAAKFGLPAPTVRAWELKQRQPDRAAQLYLRMIEHEPEAVERALKHA